MAPITLPPFPSKYQLRPHLSALDCVLEASALYIADGEPLSSVAVNDFLQREVNAPILNELYPYLWLVAKRFGNHIDALHKHRIQKRNITIAEDPALHLAYYYDTLYLKPIPQCLFNYAFWKEYLLPSKSDCPGAQQVFDIDSNSRICRAALGYLRSYSFLVQHESGFLIAQRADLIPKDISYHDFRRFILPFRSIPDEDVSPRYHFGQFSFTRLTFVVHLLRPPFLGGKMIPSYHKPYWQGGDYLRRFGTPLVFLFAAFSVILSAMQVTLAALGQDAWPAFTRASWVFSVAVIMLVAGLAASFMLGILGRLLTQGQWVLRTRHEEKVARARTLSA